MTTIYKSYGVLSHEKQPVYSVSSPASDIYDEINVEIPYPVWRTVSGDLGVTIDGTDYLLAEVLKNWGDEPALVWFDGKSERHKVLTVVG